MIAVLFDMDGTLLDLLVEIDEVRAQLVDLFRPLGYDGDFTPILPCIDAAVERVARGQEQRERLARTARKLIDDAEMRAAARATPRPGAFRTLQRLVDAGVDFGLITDNGRGCVPVALRSAGLDELPWRAEAVVTRDEAMPKPHPEGVARCARFLLPGGGALWYVGDSVRDVEAARAAGDRLADGAAGAKVEIVCAAVLGGRSLEAQLEAACPDHLVENLAELWSLEPWRVR